MVASRGCEKPVADAGNISRNRWKSKVHIKSRYQATTIEYMTADTNVRVKGKSKAIPVTGRGGL
jgi:hypothetical protein